MTVSPRAVWAYNKAKEYWPTFKRVCKWTLSALLVWFGFWIGICLVAVVFVYGLFGVLFSDERCVNSAKGVFGVLKSLVGFVYRFVVS